MKRKFTIIDPNLGRDAKLPKVPKVVFNEKHEPTVIFSENKVRVLPLESSLPEHHSLFVNKYPFYVSTSSRMHHKGIGNMEGEPISIRRAVWFREVDDEGRLGPVQSVSDLISYMDASFGAVLRDIDGHLRSINGKNGNAFGPCVDVITFREDTYDNGDVRVVPVMMDSVIVPYDSGFEDISSNGAGDFNLVKIHQYDANLRKTILQTIEQRNHLPIDYNECFPSDYISQNLLGYFFLLECEITGSFILRAFGFIVQMLFKDRFIFKKYFEWKWAEFSKYIPKNKS